MFDFSAVLESLYTVLWTGGIMISVVLWLAFELSKSWSEQQAEIKKTRRRARRAYRDWRE